MRKWFTRLILNLLSKDVLFTFFASKQEIKAQHLFNNKILNDQKEVEQYLRDKNNDIFKTLRSLQILVNNSNKIVDQFVLISYLNELGKNEIIKVDLDKLSAFDVNQIIKILQSKVQVIG